MKNREIVFTNTATGWQFGSATATTPKGDGPTELRIEVDAQGQFWHVYDNGQTFEADAADVAQLAADTMHGDVLAALLAYGPCLDKSACDLDGEDVARLNDYAARAERRLAS